MKKRGISTEILLAALIVLIVLGTTAWATYKLFSAEQKGLSKAALECTYLDFIPFLCSEEDKQKLDQNNPEQIQLRKQQIDNFLEKVVSTFNDCGKNTQQTCKCSLEFSKILNAHTTIVNVGTDGFVHIQNMYTGFNQKIEGMKKIYINDEKNSLIELTPLYLIFDTVEERIDSEGILKTFSKIPVLKVNTGAKGETLEIASYYKTSDMDSIAIVKQGANKGFYFKYPNFGPGYVNIPEC